MPEIAAWTGIIASLLTIVSFVFSPKLRAVVSNRVTAYGIALFKREWDASSLNPLIAKARTEVAILQTWIPTLGHDINHWEQAENRVRFRILLAGDNIVEARLACRPRVQPATGENLKRLVWSGEGHGETIEIRKYTGVPFGPVYIIDDDIYWGLYLAHRDSLRGPRFKTSKNSYIGAMILESFDAIWHSSNTTTVTRGGRSNAETREAPPVLHDERYEVTSVRESNFQRKCVSCGNWLGLRTVERGGASVDETYCPNPGCPRGGETVETVHLA